MIIAFRSRCALLGAAFMIWILIEAIPSNGAVVDWFGLGGLAIGLIPLVILRGSGDSTRSLGLEAAKHGVRTMAHADGGGVLYVDAAADLDLAA